VQSGRNGKTDGPSSSRSLSMRLSASSAPPSVNSVSSVVSPFCLVPAGAVIHCRGAATG
jgi:hypothetical protein